MPCEIELEVGPGAKAGEVTTRVLEAPSGGGATETAKINVTRLLGDRDDLETLVVGSGLSGGGSGGEDRLRRMGQQLFEALFTGRVLGTYRASLGIALERHEPLRIVLQVTSPRLAALPWEALFDPDTATYVCRKEQLVRHAPAPYTPEPVTVSPPLRVLGVVAAPAGQAGLDSTGEQQRLSDALKAPIAQGRIEVDWVVAASWDAVQDKLITGHWHVLHFVGHGDYDAEAERATVTLVGADGSANSIEAQHLADLLTQPDSVTRLVVLNSCSSGESGTKDLLSSAAATLVHSGIGAVAAMQFAISDPAAVAFGRGFYTALAGGQSVEDATRAGRLAILGLQSLEWVTPVLYVRGDTTQLFAVGARRGHSAPRPVLIGAVVALVLVLVGAAFLLWPRGGPPPPQPAVLSVGRTDVNLGSPCEGQQGWVFPQTIDTLPVVTHVSDVDWVARYGGVPASGDYYAFSLSALTQDSVLIEKVEADVVDRQDPIRGVYPAPWSGGCGGLIPSLFRANLDNVPVSVIAVAGEGTGEPQAAIPLPHIIDKNRPEVWHLSAVTDTCHCQWVARIHWRVGDRTGVETLDDHGKPFSVTAITAATRIDNRDGTSDTWRVSPSG